MTWTSGEQAIRQAAQVYANNRHSKGFLAVKQLHEALMQLHSTCAQRAAAVQSTFAQRAADMQLPQPVVPQTVGAELKVLVQERERMRDEVLANERYLQQLVTHTACLKARNDSIIDRVHAMTHMLNTDENRSIQHQLWHNTRPMSVAVVGLPQTSVGASPQQEVTLQNRQVAKETRMPLHRVDGNSVYAVDKNPRPLSPLLSKPDPQTCVTPLPVVQAQLLPSMSDINLQPAQQLEAQGAAMLDDSNITDQSEVTVEALEGVVASVTQTGNTQTGNTYADAVIHGTDETATAAAADTTTAPVPVPPPAGHVRRPRHTGRVTAEPTEEPHPQTLVDNPPEDNLATDLFDFQYDLRGFTNKEIADAFYEIFDAMDED